MTRAEVVDLVERAVYTAIESGLAVVVAAGAGWLDADVWSTAGVAAGAAGLSAIKTWLVARRQNVSV